MPTQEPFFTKYFPTLFILGIGLSLGFCDFFFSTLIYSKLQIIRYYILNFIISFLFLCLWIWCWIATAANDAGSVKGFLKSRQLLSDIQDGFIPESLRHLQICPECMLPKPPHAKHCDICGTCQLRYDHHCGVFGNCIADKNFKSFILSFWYGALFCFSIVPSSVEIYKMPKYKHKTLHVLSIILLLYGGILGVFLIYSMFSFLIGNLETFSVAYRFDKNNPKKRFRMLFKTFGNHWYEYFIPTQKYSKYGWPGVIWDQGEYLL